MNNEKGSKAASYSIIPFRGAMPVLLLVLPVVLTFIVVPALLLLVSLALLVLVLVLLLLLFILLLAGLSLPLLLPLPLNVILKELLPFLLSWYLQTSLFGLAS